MKATNPAHSISSLHSDVLSEVIKQLPTASHRKPWRDVLSLATTCKMFNRWKNDLKKSEIKNHWARFPGGLPGPIR